MDTVILKDFTYCNLKLVNRDSGQNSDVDESHLLCTRSQHVATEKRNT